MNLSNGIYFVSSFEISLRIARFYGLTTVMIDNAVFWYVNLSIN